MRSADSSANESGGPTPGGRTLEVFWRPRCPYCSRLRRELTRRQVPAAWRNIWEDPDARDVVRAQNAGNETVPTVRVGTEALTNPSWTQIASLLGPGPWNEPPQPSNGGNLLRVVMSWLPVILFVIISLALTFSGHDSIAWGADALAVASWWLTRPLRA